MLETTVYLTWDECSCLVLIGRIFFSILSDQSLTGYSEKCFYCDEDDYFFMFQCTFLSINLLRHTKFVKNSSAKITFNSLIEHRFVEFLNQNIHSIIVLDCIDNFASHNHVVWVD